MYVCMYVCMIVWVGEYTGNWLTYSRKNLTLGIWNKEIC